MIRVEAVPILAKKILANFQSKGRSRRFRTSGGQTRVRQDLSTKQSKIRQLPLGPQVPAFA